MKNIYQSNLDKQIEYSSIQSELIAILKMMNYLAKEKVKLENKLAKLKETRW